MATGTARTRPEAVTALLSALLDSVGGVPADAEAMRALPCGTREWLLQWTAARVSAREGWYEVSCTHCGMLFDISLDISQPICAAPGLPAREVSVETSVGTRRFAVPTGAEEERFARLPHVRDPRRALAALCERPTGGHSHASEPDGSAFTEQDLERIEAALEEASPDVADTMQAHCPDCGAATEARIDPLRFAFPDEADVLERIHLIADGYGWPLAEILGLSRRHIAWFADRVALDRRAGGRPQ